MDLCYKEFRVEAGLARESRVEGRDHNLLYLSPSESGRAFRQLIEMLEGKR